MTPGFRGWTGSERLDFFITENEATPGYLPGPLLAGRWHLLLGLYKIGDRGCDCKATVRVERGESSEQRAVSSKRPAPTS